MVHLPDELLERIFDNFRLSPDEEDCADNAIELATLISICKVSKSCHRAAQHALFGTLNLNFLNAAKIALLLRRMIEQPAARHLVRHVSADYVGTWQAEDQYTAVRAPIVPAMMACVDGLEGPTSWQDRMRDGLKQGTGDATFSLLLCLCSRRVTSIDINIPHGYEDSLLLMIFEHAAAGQLIFSNDHKPLFASLHEIKARHWDTEGSTDLLDLHALLRQPFLRVFRGFMLDCTSDSRGSSLESSRLTHIYLEYSNVDGAGLGWILRTCPHLETLAVELGDAVVNVDDVNYGDFANALRSHGTSLQELRLDAPYGCLHESEGLLSDLRALVKLRVLLVPYDALFGHDADLAIEQRSNLFEMLPPSLQTLGIGEADKHMTMAEIDDPSMTVFAKAAFPNLQICLQQSACLSTALKKHGWEKSGEMAFADLCAWQTWEVMERVVSSIEEQTW